MKSPVADMEPGLDMDQFCQMVMQGFRNRLVADIAAVVNVECQQCNGKHYHGVGAVVPCRDEDNKNTEDRSGDHVHEVVWLVCMTCGAVYDTFNMEVVPEQMLVTGRPDPTEGDAEFMAHVRQAAGFALPGVVH